MKTMRSILVAGIAMVAMNSVAANKIYINDFTLNPGETQELIIHVECDEDWGGVQVRIMPPEGLSFEKVQGARVATPITDVIDPDWMAFTQKILTMDNEDTPDIDDTGCLSFVAGGVQGEQPKGGIDYEAVKIKVKASDDYDNSGKLMMYNLRISNAAGTSSHILPNYFVATNGGSDVIETVSEKAVKDVKYFNLLGVESAEPFQGVNVVVTTYEDGSKSAKKVVK